MKLQYNIIILFIKSLWLCFPWSQWELCHSSSTGSRTGPQDILFPGNTSECRFPILFFHITFGIWLFFFFSFHMTKIYCSWHKTIITFSWLVCTATKGRGGMRYCWGNVLELRSSVFPRTWYPCLHLFLPLHFFFYLSS